MVEKLITLPFQMNSSKENVGESKALQTLTAPNHVAFKSANSRYLNVMSRLLKNGLSSHVLDTILREEIFAISYIIRF